MDNREAIIQKDKQETPILKIAQEYGVSFTTIYSLLRKWGLKRNFKRKYFKLPKTQKTEREKKFIAFKRKLSPETLAKMRENTRINNRYIKFYDAIETTHDKFLVHNILKSQRQLNE